MKELSGERQAVGNDPKIVECDHCHPCECQRGDGGQQVARVPESESERHQRRNAANHEGASNFVQALELLQMASDDVADGLDSL